MTCTQTCTKHVQNFTKVLMITIMLLATSVTSDIIQKKMTSYKTTGGNAARVTYGPTKRVAKKTG